MTVSRATQAAVISVQGGVAVPRITQAAVISVQSLPAANSRVVQSAVIAIVANNFPVITLGNPIALPCWSPCASYGTSETVIFRKRK